MCARTRAREKGVEQRLSQFIHSCSSSYEEEAGYIGDSGASYLTNTKSPDTLSGLGLDGTSGRILQSILNKA